MGASREGSAPQGGPGEAIDDTIDAVREAPDGPLAPAEPCTSRDYPSLVEVDPAHYEIGEEIGAGGMGRIFDARDRRFGRPVAVKQLRPGSADARRFEQEARITARLQHPGIVAVYEAGVWPSGEPFYAMRRVVGRSLDQVVAERDTLQQRLALLPHAIAAGNALAYAHSQQVIHRDLKPRNVLVGEFGETVIIDWGLARELSDEDAEIDAGLVVGTPAYMPPEQARGEPADRRADVYALGALLYHMMAGEAPYTGSSSKEVVDQVIVGPPRPLEERQPGVPADLLAIVRKAMARDPADRYPTAAEMTVDLERFQTGQLVGAYRYSAIDRLLRFVQRHRAAVAIAVIAIAAVASITALSIQSIVDEREVAHRQREEADRQRARATRQTLELLEEQGRQELLAGRAGRALAYLGAAMQGGHTTPTVRQLIAEARRPFDMQVQQIAAHGDRVRTVGYSPDGALILSAGDDGVAKLWDTDGTLHTELVHRGPVYRAAFAGTGERIVTASADGTAGLWSADGERVATLEHDAAVLDAGFDADARRVVTASEDGTAGVWDADTGARIATLEHGDEVLHAELSFDGSRVVTAGRDGVAIVWSADGRRLRALEGHSEMLTWASFSADLEGTRVVTASVDGTARVWDTESGRTVAVLQGHGDEVLSAVFRRDDVHVLTASRDRTARVWDAATGKLVATLAGHSGAVLAARYSPDQRRVLTTSDDGALEVWSPETGNSLIHLEGHAGGVNAAAFDRAGERIASAGDDGTVRIWRAHIAGLQSRIDTRVGQISAVAFGPEGRRLITGSSDKTARLWSAETGEPIDIVEEGESTVFAVAFSPDGARVATGSGDGIVRLHPIGAAASEARELAGHRGAVYAVAFDPAGARLASGGEDGVVRVWEVATGEALVAAQHDAAVSSVQFSRDGRELLSASTDGTAQVWEARSGTLRPAFEPVGSLHGAAFRPGGGYLLCGPSGAELRDGDGALLFTLEGAGWVYAGAFSPDGAVIATASADRVARLWDAETGKLLTLRAGQRDQLLAVTFSPDGQLLATASRDGSVAVWDVARYRGTWNEIADLVNTRVPWRLVDGRLVPVQPTD